MLFESQIISRGSGSIGGLTTSHNRGGIYFRAKAIPVDPSTPLQNVVRATMALLTNRFANTLTQDQRDAWAIYAANVELTGPLGNPRNVGAIGMYVRSNLPRAIAPTLPLVDDAPTIFDLGAFTPVAVLSLTAATNVLSLDFTEADDWVGEDEAALLFFSSRPVNPSINYFTGPYRFADTILGNLALPPTTPDPLDIAFNVEVGQRQFAYVRVTRADGRLSGLQRLTALAV